MKYNTSFNDLIESEPYLTFCINGTHMDGITAWTFKHDEHDDDVVVVFDADNISGKRAEYDGIRAFMGQPNYYTIPLNDLVKGADEEDQFQYQLSKDISEIVIIYLEEHNITYGLK